MGIVDNNHSTRKKVGKFIFNYIKSKKLYDENNKRIIICDEALNKLLKCDTNPPKDKQGNVVPLTYYNLKEYLQFHYKGFVKTYDPCMEIFNRPVNISSELAKFLGKDEKEPHRRLDTVKLVYDYVKTNNLNKDDLTHVLCDEKLAELLKSKSNLPTDDKGNILPIGILSLQHHLKPHFSKLVV